MTHTIRSRSAAAALTAAAGLALAVTAGAPAQAALVAQSPTGSSIHASQVTAVSATTYADRLVRAWGRGDYSATRYYATAAVTDKLFDQVDPCGIHWRRTRVEGTAGTIYATYRDEARGGTLTVGVSDIALHDGNPAHSVYTALFEDEPASLGAVAWADHLVRAWGRGDHWTASYYATPDVLSQLFGYANPGGSHWDRVSAQGAAGTIFVTYRNTATGAHLTLGVSDVVLGEGGAHAAYTLRF